ncbi:hypothetical protein ALON55S_01024 [Alishewanella longhuensis]
MYLKWTNVVNNRCAGRLDHLGVYQVGSNSNQQLVNAYFGWAGNPLDTTNRWIPTADTTLNLTVESTEVVSTPLGRFEAYKVKVIKNVISRNAFMYSVGNESINGYYWVHPAVGVVKADYVLTRQTSSIVGTAEIYDVSYSIFKNKYYLLKPVLVVIQPLRF